MEFSGELLYALESKLTNSNATQILKGFEDGLRSLNKSRKAMEKALIYWQEQSDIPSNQTAKTEAHEHYHTLLKTITNLDQLIKKLYDRLHLIKLHFEEDNLRNNQD